jgi:hypothetical protein
VASGPKSETLTSQNFSHAFQAPLRLQSRNGRYQLVLQETGALKKN